MNKRVICFIPPVLGVDGEFNTFRIGSFYAKNLVPGEEVLLMNEKEKLVFGTAVVEWIDEGSLGEMCLIHGHKNHSQSVDPLGPNSAPERLFKKLQRIYGPHIATVNKKATVVYLRRIYGS